MDNPRPEKVAVVDEVKTRLGESDAAILTEYRGLSVKNLADLRATLRESGGEYKIYKNTLVRFAVRDLDLSELEASLTGPTAIAFVKGDAAAVAKVLKDFAKTNPNLVVKGGVLGNRPLSAQDASALADLPARDVVLSQLAGLLAQPMQQFASLLQTLPRNFAYGIKALIDQGGAPGAPAPVTVAEAPTDEPATDEPATDEPATEAEAEETPAAEAEAEAEAEAAEEEPSTNTESE